MPAACRPPRRLRTGLAYASGRTVLPVDAPGGRPVAALTQSLMADELPDGLVVADDAGRVVVFNRAAAG